MSPRYVPDPTKASMGFAVFPKGNYRLEIGEPKAFVSMDKVTQQAKNWGVRANGKVISADDSTFIGKQFPVTMYMHTEGSENFSKGIYGKILGCAKDEEFNSKYASEDWSFNTDDGSVGSGWRLLKGKIVDVVCGDVGKDTNDNEQTKIESWRVAQ